MREIKLIKKCIFFDGDCIAEIDRLQAALETARGLLSTVIDDSTGDLDNLDKRVWPIRAKLGRLIRNFFEDCD